MLRESVLAGDKHAFDSHCERLQLDLLMLEHICTTRYFSPRPPIPKCGNLHLAFEYANNPHFHGRFQRMLRVSPFVFNVLVELVKDHPIFHNNSTQQQIPVDYQLAITLYRMGRFGNGASIEDIAMIAGISAGGVELCTRRCFDAIESLHDLFVRPLTNEEKEMEKKWVDKQIGFQNSLWCKGWVMYDGTIVVLHAAPRFNGHAYFTRKSNYGLNLQVCISNLLSDFAVSHLFYRLEMFLQLCVLLTILMVILGLHMMPPPLNLLLPLYIQNGYLLARSSHG